MKLKEGATYYCIFTFETYTILNLGVSYCDVQWSGGYYESDVPVQTMEHKAILWTPLVKKLICAG